MKHDRDNHVQHVCLPYAAAHSCPNYRTDREADCFTDSAADFGANTSPDCRVVGYANARIR